jgi:hypothetical protein
MTRIVVIVACAALGAGGAYCYLTIQRGSSNAAPTNDRPATARLCQKHRIEEARCPFCNPGLVARMGECKEHGVAEALCYRCHPELVAAFKIEGDWCAAHGAPESQCEICKRGDRPAGERTKSAAGQRTESAAEGTATGGQP